ncbi:hypothetical protein HZH66_009473 [Vespula vulgaris]|uniref:Uncharacterized protein n=1 Tax=Vespula vulgaris TaxID=7454 RepID=A0A834N1Q6_VESVU|nr:hypothetical protein HZH66_009473 [Vespula vulgaris]
MPSCGRSKERNGDVVELRLIPSWDRPAAELRASRDDEGGIEGGGGGGGGSVGDGSSVGDGGDGRWCCRKAS